jgi:hypothetical protein
MEFGEMTAQSIVEHIITYSIVLPIYLIPTIVAACRHHHQLLAIAALNVSVVVITAFAVFFLFGMSDGESDRVWLGSTVIGWIAALVWACTEVRRTAVVYAQGDQGSTRPPPLPPERPLTTLADRLQRSGEKVTPSKNA